MVVVAISIYFQLSLDDWRWIILAIGFVWLAEVLNTAIERLADAVTLEQDPSIGYAKDVAAGAVLTAVFVSTAIGLTVFVPHLILV